MIADWFLKNIPFYVWEMNPFFVDSAPHIFTLAKEWYEWHFIFFIIMKKYALRVFASLSLLGILPTYADGLKNISLDFCDITGNILQYAMDPWTHTGICYVVSNSSDQETTMKINFIDGTFTNDQRQNRACLDETSKENFGQYVSAYTQLITLTWGERRQEMAQLSYPQWTDGQYHGCITYSVVNAPVGSETGENSNFTILMRKAKFIDVLVGHPEKITWGITLKDFDSHAAWGANISPNHKIRIYQDPSDNKYVIELTVQNIGWVEENVVITWIVSNFLMYKRTFVESRKILKWQEFIITKKLDETPNYDLTVDISIAYTPVISGLSPDIVPQTSYVHETAHIFIINIITIATGIGLLLLLLIIILLIRSSRKKAQPVPWPIAWTPSPAPTGIAQ